MKREPPFYGGARVASRRVGFFYFPPPLSPIFPPSLVRLHRAFHVLPGEIYSIRRFKLILILILGPDGARSKLSSISQLRLRLVAEVRDRGRDSLRWKLKLLDGPQFFHACILPLSIEGYTTNRG